MRSLILNVSFLFSILLLVTSCTFTKKIKDGTMAFDLRQYAVAVELLEKEYQNSSDQQSRARIAFTLGEAYWRMGEVIESLPWYEKANEHKFGPRALEKKAFALKYQQNYPAAIDVFNRLLREGTQLDLYRKEIAICRIANDWLLEKNKKYEINRAYFNSKSSDYAPYFLDDHRLFFSSDRKNGSSEVPYLWTGRDFSDLYMYNVHSEEVSHLDPIINTNHNEGTLSFNEDGSVLYFTRCYAETEYDEYCKILSSNYVDGKWSLPKVLPFIEDGINYGHPFWVEKDSILFFSSKQSSGLGGFDLYFSYLSSDGQWSSPINMGPKINTEQDEKFPTLKNDTLYFSSNGHPGMGGLDIFYTFIDDTGNWETPYNMKSPINSGADDFSIVFEPDPFGYLDQGFFSSSRNGDDDIFSFKRAPKTPDDEVVIGESPKEIKKTIKLAVTVIREDENGTKDVFPAAKLAINDKSVNLNNRGFVLQDITPGTYEISANYPGFFSVKQMLTASLDDINPGSSSHTYNKTIILKPIIKDKEIVLENIFYDFNKYFIRDDAKPSLNELASLLYENPEILIELSSHTDCRGPDAYNLTLSQQRAQSAVDYIVGLGISPMRITAKGYGETIPKASCDCEQCSEEEHQLNRRTSFRITDIK